MMAHSFFEILRGATREMKIWKVKGLLFTCLMATWSYFFNEKELLKRTASLRSDGMEKFRVVTRKAGSSDLQTQTNTDSPSTNKNQNKASRERLYLFLFKPHNWYLLFSW